MAKFPMDLSKFKKVKSDKNHTVMRHPDGHEFHIKHEGLDPKHRDALSAIPVVAMADGGEVEDAPIKEIDLKETPVAQDAPTAPAATPVETPDTAPPTAEAPAAETPVATPIDPVIQEKRNLYNSIVAPQDPSAGKTGTPDADAQSAQVFGPKGEEPKSFNAVAWAKAEDAFNQKEIQAQQAQAAQAQDIANQNTQRAKAGLAPLAAAAPGQTPNAAAPQSPGAAAPAPTGPNDPYGTQAYFENYGKGIAEQKAGFAQEAQATIQQGQEQSALLKSQVAKQQQNLDNYHSAVSDLEKERQHFQKDVADFHVDPNHYWASKSTGGKIATAIGMIIGGLGGSTGVSQFVDKQIANDIDAQKAELGKKENLLSANLKQFGNLKDATDMTRVMQMDIASNMMKQAAANAATPLAKARLLQESGKLDMTAAPILGQIAMRKTLLSSMQAGNTDPAKVIMAIVPKEQQQHAYDELKTAQTMVKAKDNVLSAFDQIASINTVGNRVTSPLQTPKRVEALRDPILASLSKETAGRFTEQDSHMLKTLFPAPGDDAKTLATKRAQVVKTISEKMNFPMLDSYGINLQGRFGHQGQNRIQESAPVLKNR
jgi:hypothetical protein